MNSQVHQCPHCSAVLEVPGDYWGMEIQCSECEEAFVADEQTEAGERGVF